VANDVVVITGAAGGMGVACARAMKDAGSLLLVDVNAETLAQAAKVLEAEGLATEQLRCDVTSLSDVEALAQRVSSLGTFRSLIHTAGISPTMADGGRVLEVDLVGTARVLIALQPLVTQGSAAVCIGSIAGYADASAAVEAILDDPLRPDFVAQVTAALGGELDPGAGYSLAKRGVMRLCERLAPVWGALGGRLVSIAPGLMDTEMGRSELSQQEMMPIMVDMTPVKRPGMGPLPGLPEDIAATAAFLCSDGGSFISGCDIRVDGGLIGASRHLGGVM
jgi:NAD(P)-dependent dehydrogenase (short-subunit alcohol dehydrogenase family)